MTVPKAAPCNPISGNGPIPNIKNGSIIILRANPDEFIINGVKLRPAPLYIPEKLKDIN